VRRIQILIDKQTIAEVFGIQSYASVNSFMYFIRGLGTMLGSPIGGVLLTSKSTSISSSMSQPTNITSSADFRNVVVFNAVLLTGASLCVLAVRVWDAVDKGAWRWRA